MKVRADVDDKFIRRFLFISIGCFAFMFWGLYDGLYKYPAELERAKIFKDLEEQEAEEKITESERKEKWEATCKENNWPITKPKTPEVAQGYVYFQWVLFGIGLVFGVFFLIKFLNLRGSWMEADEAGVITSWGQELSFKDIHEINKSKWAKKGIANVRYTADSGKEKVMVFDDFKYHRETMGMILKLAEKQLSDSQIVGGKKEPESNPYVKDGAAQEEIATIEDE